MSKTFILYLKLRLFLLHFMQDVHLFYQLYNVLFVAVEEVPGRFTTNIKNLFNLDAQLAMKYCVLIFIAVHR